MTAFIINPGTGPVEDATADHAYTNMEALLKDAGVKGATFRRDTDAEEEDGRFSFDVSIPGYTERHGTVPVDMPGIPLDEVRYLGPPQDIWDFPRLYVNGSSWVWKFAVSILGGWLEEHEKSECEKAAYRAKLRREREAQKR